jgi:putative acetyltransferase
MAWNGDVRRSDLGSQAAGTLIGRLNAELSAAYPEPGATHFGLRAEEVARGRGAFLVAFDGETPVACGAVRLLEDGDAEIKRMFVAPEMRGRGVGAAVLRALEAEARKLRARRIILETGIRQTAAIALYERKGFERIPAYGEYVNSPATSVCMGKDLAA